MNICDNIKKIIQLNTKQAVALRKEKELKPDGSFVSKGDLLIQEKVEEYTEGLGDEYFLISEEKDNSGFSFDQYTYAIIIDPVDGTENFVSGLKEWGVGVSVYQAGKHLESLIALPELDLYIQSGDTFPKYESRIYGISSSLTREQLQSLEQGYEYRIIGCAMYNMYNVITGSYALFQNPKGAYIWDLLPGLNLALENNCKVTVEGKPYGGEFLSPDRTYRFRVEH